jgi:transcriptional regulator with XRE-family HTH domain
MASSVEMHIAKSVSAYRLIRKLSQAELAAKCGVTRQAIDRLERGQAMPSMRMLEALAKAFEVAPSELLP